MTCKEQVALSSDYPDGQLSFREKLRVRHHLMLCPIRRRLIRQMRLMRLMRLMRATLSAIPEDAKPDLDSFAERLVAKLRKDLLPLVAVFLETD
ncbi:zf-HC2 domain-containing protein [Pseudomonas arsenicoxydans]|uniref:Zf-HC2 domain-containing protein n=1 Tax=Pseudomonas arsenicoxydans TaxID=702115 RepID=A0A502HTA5_9PSED|nr:zf-HC2 domain-containing protein [Pseudomonas arsenicoxydans]TPG76418.1 zf-HC2 domain-containing protein [Pseudomonas arsenicoxydans]